MIPTHNRAGQLLRTLSCALGQRDIRLEVVVVDDGSRDRTPQALAGIDDARLRVIRLPASRGVANARNVGIANARSEWLAFLDDDDLWAPTKLRCQLDAATAQGVDALYCGAARVTIDGQVLEIFSLPQPENLPTSLYGYNALPSGPSNVIARKRLVEQVGGFDEQFSFVADWDMWLMLAKTGRFGAIPDVLVGYVDHDGSMTVTGSSSVAREYRDLVRKHMSPASRDLFDPHGFTRWRAAVHLHAGRNYRAGALFLRTGLAGSRIDLLRATLLFGGGPLYRFVKRRIGWRPAALLQERQALPTTQPKWLTSLPPRHVHDSELPARPKP